MSDLSRAEIKERVDRLLSSNRFSTIFNKFINRINSAEMLPIVSQGVVVGFSAGPDSVILLCALLHFKSLFMPDLKISALHVNHMIRGDEADRDEQLALDFCNALSVDISVERHDVPTIAKGRKLGLEECARDIRYNAFETMRHTKNYGSVAVAHNADDNVETVMLNILRGSGLNGISGIRSVRGNIIRPLLDVSKEEILNALKEFGIPYAVDSTNSDSDYSRNYLRNNVIPLFKSINPSYLNSFSNLSKILREDNEYLDKCAEIKFNSIKSDLFDGVCTDVLLSLEKPIRSRVICFILQSLADNVISFVAVERIEQLLNGEGRISVGGNFDIAVLRKRLYLIDTSKDLSGLYYDLNYGENKISEMDLAICIGDVADKSYSNVYKFSIHTYLPSAIINDGLFVRCRRDGDSIYFGGMTRKLKKIYNDRNIPSFLRDLIPIICDKNGILWVPGLPLRSDKELDHTETVKISMFYNSKFNVAHKN